MPEVEFRTGANSVVEMVAEFDRRKERLDFIAAETKRLIERILEAEGLVFQSVQARVKSKDKIKLKYCKPNKDYKCLDEISDLVGLRVITYYSDSIDRVRQIISREFETCGEVDDKRIGPPDSFGYSAVHMDCTYLKARTNNPEYRKLVEAKFEIQITTVLGHAWSEMHHAWYDSTDSPLEEERRFYRLAAVLELAEQEFLEIRKRKEQRVRSASVRVAANAPGIPINGESLVAFVEQSESLSALDVRLAAILGGTAEREPTDDQIAVLVRFLTSAGISTVEDLETWIGSIGPVLEEYVRRSEPSWLAAQGGKLSDTYTKGFSIFHGVNLIMGARGMEKFQEFLATAGRTAPPEPYLTQQVEIAVAVSSQYRLP